MPSRRDIEKMLTRELPDLRDEFGVTRLGLCGSVVRDEHDADSDIDLLVTFEETPGLLEIARLERHLEDKLGLEVDIGMPSALGDGPAADNIRREVQYL
ncbi:MAG: nucleotidyltransferase family protein [Bradymonadaceae bacterium]